MVCLLRCPAHPAALPKEKGESEPRIFTPAPSSGEGWRAAPGDEGSSSFSMQSFRHWDLQAALRRDKGRLVSRGNISSHLNLIMPTQVSPYKRVSAPPIGAHRRLCRLQSS